MDKFDITSNRILKKSPVSKENIFDSQPQDYKALALTLIEFSRAVYELADHLRTSLLTNSQLSTKHQKEG